MPANFDAQDADWPQTYSPNASPDDGTYIDQDSHSDSETEELSIPPTPEPAEDCHCFSDYPCALHSDRVYDHCYAATATHSDGVSQSEWMSEELAESLLIPASAGMEANGVEPPISTTVELHAFVEAPTWKVPCPAPDVLFPFIATALVRYDRKTCNSLCLAVHASSIPQDSCVVLATFEVSNAPKSKSHGITPPKSRCKFIYSTTAWDKPSLCSELINCVQDSDEVCLIEVNKLRASSTHFRFALLAVPDCPSGPLADTASILAVSDIQQWTTNPTEALVTNTVFTAMLLSPAGYDAPIDHSGLVDAVRAYSGSDLPKWTDASAPLPKAAVCKSHSLSRGLYLQFAVESVNFLSEKARKAVGALKLKSA